MRALFTEFAVMLTPKLEKNMSNKDRLPDETPPQNDEAIITPDKGDGDIEQHEGNDAGEQDSMTDVSASDKNHPAEQSNVDDVDALLASLDEGDSSEDLLTDELDEDQEDATEESSDDERGSLRFPG